METAPGPTGRPDCEGQAGVEADVLDADADPAAAERGTYLGFVAHEVRNPLSTALWSAELLVRMPAAERGGARGEKLSAMCLRSLARVRHLVEDHFMCERLDAGALPMRSEPLDVRELLEGIAAKRPPEAPPLELRIAGLVAVNADRTLLERTLDALVALAGREDAAVIVDVKVREGIIWLTFNGQPCSEELLLDPGKGTAGDPRGRALAGPLARRAAEVLGGSLRVVDGAFVLALGAPSLAPRPP
jgi:hypothetical protein